MRGDEVREGTTPINVLYKGRQAAFGFRPGSIEERLAGVRSGMYVGTHPERYKTLKPGVDNAVAAGQYLGSFTLTVL